MSNENKAVDTAKTTTENVAENATPIEETNVVEQKSAEGTEVEAPKKKSSRRGIASARGASRLKFTHDNAAPNGLFLTHLESVEVKMIEIGEETTGLPSFTGLTIPRLSFTFSSNEPEISSRKYAVISFTAVESNVETIPGGDKEWKVQSILDWIKHAMDVYVLRGRDFTEAEQEKLSLSFEDFIENEIGEFDYEPIDVEDVIAGWTELFTNVSEILNNGNAGKPFFKTNAGKDVPVWLKLVRHIKHPKKGWQNTNNGDLGIPGFVGEGVIELFVQNRKPSIYLNPMKEAIVPKEIAAAKAPNLAGGPGVMGVGGVNMGGMQGMDTTGFGSEAANLGQEADEDLPF